MTHYDATTNRDMTTIVQLPTSMKSAPLAQSLLTTIVLLPVLAPFLPILGLMYLCQWLADGE